jgi:6-phosphofructokinase 1
VDTFGYQTARHYGVEIVKNLMVDAKTTSLVSGDRDGAQGRAWRRDRQGGRRDAHDNPREFAGQPIPLRAMVDTLVGDHQAPELRPLRRVAIIAEGLVLDIDPADSRRSRTERDAHGHVAHRRNNIEILKRRCRSA